MGARPKSREKKEHFSGDRLTLILDSLSPALAKGMATAKVSKAPKENVAQRLKRYKQEKKAAKIEENKKTMSKSTATSRRAALSTLKSNAASATTLSALKEKLDAAKSDEVEHFKKVAIERGEESDTRKVTAAASRSLSRTKTSSQIPPKAKYSLSTTPRPIFVMSII